MTSSAGRGTVVARVAARLVAAGCLALAMAPGASSLAWCAEAPGRTFHLDDAKGHDASDGLSPELVEDCTGVRIRRNRLVDVGKNAIGVRASLAPVIEGNEVPGTARGAFLMPKAPDGVVIERDVAYLPPGRAEKLDLYLPAARRAGARSPAVVLIHGGGWTGGDKGGSREFDIGTTLAKAGYVAASVNYTIEGDARWPANLLDCKNAVRFLRARAERYQVDAGRIGVIGGSAGGHLALMVGYTSGVSGLEPEAPYPGVSSAVGAVVDMYGPANLLTRQTTDAHGNPTGQVRLDSALLSTKAREDEAGWRRASPVSHVRKGLPPTLILHGDADPTVDREQSLELARALERAGATHQILLLPGVGHSFDLQRWSRGALPTDLRPVVVGFLDQHLRR